MCYKTNDKKIKLNKSYTLHKKEDVIYLSFNKLDNYNWINNSFSTRFGGKSSGCFYSMNLSNLRDETKEKVDINRKIYANAINAEYNKMVYALQRHTTNILTIDKNNINNNIYNNDFDLDFIDGFITNEKDIVLCTKHADCTPIYLVDTNKKVIALLHSGWMGTLNNISKNAINIFKEKYNSNPKNIISIIGPSICASCFEIKDDVEQLFLKKDKNYKSNIIKKDNKTYMNLWEINKRNLINEGLDEENIDIVNLCTKCNPEIFFSHRYHGKDRGGMIATLSII
ncbi:MAG: peptidoglycan editing factor PgeF [Eubacteriales bacterium]|nr:peptidoglycan editing factor PgeF [Eubacteriales bacterium]